MKYKSHLHLRLAKNTAFAVLIGLMMNLSLNAEASTWRAAKPVYSRPTIQSQLLKPAAAIDKLGNVVTLWNEQRDSTGKGQIWAKSRTPLGVWSTPMVLDTAMDNQYVQVEMRADGKATAIWSNSTGLWGADKSLGQPWDAKKLLAVAPALGFGTIKLSMNDKGDTLLTWVEGSYIGSKIKFVRRSANTPWSVAGNLAISAQPLPGGNGLNLFETVVGETGDMLVAWGRYGIHPHGYLGNTPVLKVSRLSKLATRWETSRSLGLPFNTYLDYRKINLLFDAKGRAGAIFFDYSKGWVMATQQGTGQAWGASSNINPMPDTINCMSPKLIPAPNTMVTSCSREGASFVGRAANDAAGNITFVYVDSYSYMGDIAYYNLYITKAVSANLATGLWGKPLSLFYKVGDNAPATTPKPELGVSRNGLVVVEQTTSMYEDPTATVPSLRIKSWNNKNNTLISNRIFNFPAGNVSLNNWDLKVNSADKAVLLFQYINQQNDTLYITTFE